MKWNPTATWVSVAAGTVVFWVLESLGSLSRLSLVVGLSCSCFAIGSGIGFLFTSYGEEITTLGKLKDWLIGGITSLTITNVASIKALLLTFAAGPGPTEFALTAGVAITYTVLGFFFMFFQRELILNVLLAQSRAQRGRFDGTSNAGFVAQILINKLPPSLLSGVDDIEEVVEEQDMEAAELRAQLYSEEVSKFLEEAQNAAFCGGAFDWDVVSKVAMLHYYRTYFEKGQAKDKQARRAEEWIKRALVMNPDHADLKSKYADVLAMMERYEEAVAVIEPLAKSTDGPAYTRQWLGYFLLFVDREDEAIKLSEEYSKQFPMLDHAYFNAACGYAQLYGKRGSRSTDLDGALKDEIEFKNSAFNWLRKGLQIDPEYAENVKEKLTLSGESFESLAGDSEFKKIVVTGLTRAAERFAGAYVREIRGVGKQKDENSSNRKRALKLLNDALEVDPESAKAAVLASEQGGSFGSLADDSDFKAYVSKLKANA